MNYTRALTRPLALLSASLWLAAVPLAVNAHPPTGAEEAETISEKPVPGVRIIREKDYDKQPARYLSSNLYTTLASARDNFNEFVAFDFIVPDKGGPLPHTHSSEWETFFVHEGELVFTIGVDPTQSGDAAFITQVVPKGTIVYGSQGPVHGFENKSGKMARIFSFAMPAGLDNFFVTSGGVVRNWHAPIPPIGLDEIERTAFWAEQRGDGLYFPIAGVQPPPPGCLPPPGPGVPPGTPVALPGYACPSVPHVVASITGPADPVRGRFGETRVHLLTQTQVGNITGAVAFCGPGFPGRPGGSVNYDYISVPNNDRFAALAPSTHVEVFYVLGGTLSFKFAGKTVDVPELTYVEIQTGVPFSVNSPKNRGVGTALTVSVIRPACESNFSFFPPPRAVGGSVQRTPTGKLPGSESAEEILERYQKRGK